MSQTPKSDEFLARGWYEFTEEVYARLAAGKRVYGDSSFDRDPARLIREIREELMDVAGWASIMDWRLRQLEEKLQKIGDCEQVPRLVAKEAA